MDKTEEAKMHIKIALECVHESGIEAPALNKIWDLLLKARDLL